MGFDDLAAVLTLRAAGVPVAGLSLVAGNTALPGVIRNACACAGLFDWKMPMHAGAAAPLAGPLVTADYVLGPDGMPGASLPEPARGPDSHDAVGALAQFLDGRGREVLALGPLTNIALLCRARPDLAPRMHLTWMGGSAGPGNHTAVAEFNAAVDPEALAEVLAAGVEVRMVGLDCCRQVTVTLADVAPLRQAPGPRAALLADLLEGYVRIAQGRPMALFDPVAAAAVADPLAVTFAPARLDAECDGRLTRGMTVIEWRARKAAPNALIATRAEAARVRDLFARGLIAAAQGEDR